MLRCHRSAPGWRSDDAARCRWGWGHSWVALLNRPLENEAGEIVVAAQVSQLFIDIASVDDQLALAAVGSAVGGFLQQALHDGVEPAGADVFRVLVDLPGDLGE